MPFLGKILEIDLSTGQQTWSPLPDEAAMKYLGGRGWNIRILTERILPGTDPLGPDNLLLISCGLLTGTRAPVSSRLHISALSPQTGLLGCSNVGGNVGAHLRACGIQSLILRGRSPRPVYLHIDRDGVSLRNAVPLWGLDTQETQKRLRESEGEGFHALVIGPGGENLVPFGCIISGRDHAAGRTGMGAVMGSKNLKAIFVRRTDAKAVPVNNRTGKDAIRRYITQIRSASEFKTFSEYGGAGYVNWCNDLGIMATRNYRENRFESADRLNGHHFKKDITRTSGCRGCPVQCKAELRFKAGKYAGKRLARPEFEGMINFGPKCGLDDPEAVVYLDNLCSRLGVDTLSTSTVISFALDLYDRGILSTEMTYGLKLHWGDADVMETLIREIVHRKGFGALLAQGVRKAAIEIGNGAEWFAPHVKGLELTAFNPRNDMGTALSYAISSRGGDFSNVYAAMGHSWSAEKATREFGTPLAVNLNAFRGKGAMVRRAIAVNIVLDSLGLCKVPALSLIRHFDLKEEAELTAALSGWSLDAEHLMAVGFRVANLERLFNMRLHAEQDRLPPMFSDVPLAPMLRDFYYEMGWDSTGRPLPETLARLGIYDWKPQEKHSA